MFLYFSIVVNLVFLYFVYIIHYKTFDLNQGRECERKIEPSARRVVLFVAEGLGSDFLYNVTEEDGSERSLLRRVIEEDGAWGVSKCFSQELSTQGNLALICGTQYDPSLILTYAKLINFNLDNVFARADDVYLLGNPHVPDFINAKRNQNWHVKAWSRRFKEEINSEGNFFAFDDYAIDILDVLFADKTHKKDNTTIYAFFLSGISACVRQSRLIQDCVNTVVNLDRQIEKAVKQFEEYYNDSSTSYILTSDRGMKRSWQTGEASTNPENTPFLAWGAGIKKHDAQANSQIDINQEDIAPLVSTLLGNQIPNGSVGVIPWQILTLDKRQLADALYCNERLINDIILVYAQETGNNDYKESLPNVDLNVTSLRIQLQAKIEEKNYSEAIDISKRLFHTHKEQLRQYKIYLKPLTWTVVIVLYLGFAFWTLQRVILKAVIKEEDFMPKLSFWSQLSKANLKERVVHDAIYDIVVTAITCTLCAFVYFKGFPCYFIFSFLLAMFIWWRVIKNGKHFIKSNVHRQTFDKLGPWMVGSVIGLIWLVFGITYPLVRQVLFGTLALSVLFTMNTRVENILQILFVLFSSILVFLLNFNIDEENPDTTGLTIGSISWFIAMGFYIYYNRGPLRDLGIVLIDFILSGLSLWNALNVRNMHADNPKTFNFLISWLVLSTGPIFPVLSTQHGIKRLCHVSFGLCATFILFSVYKEVIGLLVYSTFLVILYCLEIRNADMFILGSREQTQTKVRKHLNEGDVKMGYFLLVFVWCGYFLTSNDSHSRLLDQRWTANFIENFDHLGPVITLFAYKMLIPIAITCSMFGLLYKQLNASMNQMLEWYLYLNIVSCLHLLINAKGEEFALDEISESVTNLALSHLTPIAVVILSKILEVYNDIDLYRFFKGDQ